MKTIIITIFSVLSVVLLYSCRGGDDDSIPQFPYYGFFRASGVIEKGTNGSLYIRTNENELLYPEEGKKLTYNNGDRVQLFGEKLREQTIRGSLAYYIEIIWIEKYSILPIQTVANNQEDILENDPIANIIYWTTENKFEKGEVNVRGDYLYMEYYYYVYDYRKHSVDIVYYEKDNPNPVSDTVWLDFRHNARDDAFVEKSKTNLATDITQFKLPEKRSRIIAVRHNAQDYISSIPYNNVHYINYKW